MIVNAFYPEKNENVKEMIFKNKSKLPSCLYMGSTTKRDIYHFNKTTMQVSKEDIYVFGEIEDRLNAYCALESILNIQLNFTKDKKW